MSAFHARYPGRCVCGDRIQPDDAVQYDEDGELCHATCVNHARDDDLSQVCQRCFEIHAGECL